MSVVKRVGVFSVGKVVGVLYALVGLILGVLFSMLSLAGIATSGLNTGISSEFVGVGVGVIVILPLLNGATGFIAGIILAAFYNMLESIIGGIEVEIVSD